MLLLLALLASTPAIAHEIPVHAKVDLRVAHHGERLEVLARVPLTSLQDLTLPLRGNGALDLTRLGERLDDAAAIWIADFLTVRLDGERLETPNVTDWRVSLPGDRAFTRAFPSIRDHVTGPSLPDSADLRPDQARFDVLLTVPLPPGADTDDIVLVPELAHLGQRTTTELRIATADGRVRTLNYLGDPGPVPLRPGILPTVRSFVVSGMEHILAGTDHLLFLLCLLLPLLRLKPLIAIVTAFTLAHSVTLIAAALGVVPAGGWFPPLVEALIAGSILWMALENLLAIWPGREGRTASPVHRWRLAFSFGLIHGFGFAFVLGDELQYAGQHLLLALVSFNVGVELGQIAALLIAVPALRLLARRMPAGALTAIASVLIAHAAWHWLLERWTAFAAHPLPAPQADLQFLQSTMQLALVGLIAWALYWLLSRALGSWLAAES